MHQLVDSLENKDVFDWEIEKIKSGPGVILYLLGTAKEVPLKNGVIPLFFRMLHYKEKDI